MARDVTGNARATLGEILKKQPGLIPRLLDTALGKICGYASNEARHVIEGREIEREEVELMIGLATAAATYLSKKFHTQES